MEVVRRRGREERVLALVDGRAGSDGGGRGWVAVNLTLVDGGGAAGGGRRAAELALVDGGGAAGSGRRGAAELALEDDGRTGRNSRRGGSGRARQLDGTRGTSKDLRLREGDSSAEETSESKTGELHFVDVIVIWMLTWDKI